MTALPTIEDQKPRLRIIATLDNEGRTALLDVLHDPRFSNLPRDSKKLYAELTNKHKTNLAKLLRKGVLKKEQWNLIFPTNQETDSTKFDLTLSKLLIIMTCTNLPPPTNGWKKPLDVSDSSIAAFIIRIIQLRNKIMHAPNSILTKAEFENFWNDLETTLNGLGYNKSIAYLKSLPFDALGQDTITACCALFSKMNKQQLERNAEFRKQTKCLVVVVAMVAVGIGYLLNSKASPDQYNLERAANDASDSLRSHYIKSVENLNLPSIKDYRLKKRFYIEPSIVEARGMLDDLTHTESITKQKGDISLKALLDSYQHDILLLQGAGGIGKTFIMENTALQWARKEIWKDVDFLFLLKFRELVKYRNFKESLIHSYQFFFKKTSIDHLQHTKNKIIFLLDGLDEFVSFNSTNVNHASLQNTCNDTSVLSGIYALLNSHCMVFPHTIIVISGRSSACQQLKSSFKMLFIPTFEVIGFNTEQVIGYIRRYFHNSHTDAVSLMRIISSSERLLMMSKVPAFLWSLCELYQEKGQLKEITTMTELYVLQLTIFLKRHFQLLNHNSTDDLDIYKLLQVRQTVFSLAKIASHMLENGMTIVDAAQFSTDIDIKQLEQSGIISKLKSSNELQFHHASTQEFLAAVQYHQTVDNLFDFFQKNSLEGCFPFFAGLRGAAISQSKSSEIIVKFVQNLSGRTPENKDLISVPDTAVHKENFLEILFEYQNGLSPPILGYKDEVFRFKSNLCRKIIGPPYDLDVEICYNFTKVPCKEVQTLTEFADGIVTHIKMRNEQSLLYKSDINVVVAANKLTEACFEKCNKTANDYEFYLTMKPSFSQSHIHYFFNRYGDNFRKNIIFLTAKTILSTVEVDIIKAYVCDIGTLLLYQLPFYETEQLKTLVTSVINCSNETSNMRLKSFLIDFFPKGNPTTIGIIELLLHNIHTFESPILRAQSNILRLFTVVCNTVTRQGKSKKFKMKNLRIITNRFNRLHCRKLVEFIWAIEDVVVEPFKEYAYDNDTVAKCLESIMKIWRTKVPVDTKLRRITVGNLRIQRNVLQNTLSYLKAETKNGAPNDEIIISDTSVQIKCLSLFLSGCALGLLFICMCCWSRRRFSFACLACLCLISFIFSVYDLSKAEDIECVEDCYFLFFY